MDEPTNHLVISFFFFSFISLIFLIFITKVETPNTFKFKFENVEKLPPPVLQFDQVSFSYSGSSKSEDLLYEDLDLAVDMDSRVALVGPNGDYPNVLNFL